MPSPFPGMDPFIEECHLFEDFHPKLIGDIERTLSQLVPSHYAVRLGERSYVVLASRGEEELRQMQPDVNVMGPRKRQKKAVRRTGTAVAEAPESNGAPVTMRALVEVEFRETFIEIRQLRGDRRLITGIEVLSPKNKRRGDQGRNLYLRKRQSFLEGSANLVEIDLLRRGERMPMEDEWPDSPYYLLVCRKKEAPTCSVWPASSLTPLLPVRVPLEPPDPDVTLDLQLLVNAIYERAHYESDIDYRRPSSLLSAREEAWLKEHLRRKPGRSRGR